MTGIHLTNTGITSFRTSPALESAVVKVRIVCAYVRIEIFQHDTVETSKLAVIGIVIALFAFAHVRTTYETLSRLECALEKRKDQTEKK
jgi:hypothetical protein